MKYLITFAFLISVTLTFAQSTQNWQKVTITYNEDDIEGLTAKGDVFAKASGGTILASAKKVKDKAIRKIKQQAANLGADIVYIHSQTNDVGGRSQQRTIIQGVAYSRLE